MTERPVPEVSAAKRRRDQRRRSVASGGGSLADERSQLIVEQRRARPTEHHDLGVSRDDDGGRRAPGRDRAAIAWLAQPIPLGPRSRLVGYDPALVSPLLAELLLEGGAT